jgi:hypothetical protein
MTRGDKKGGQSPNGGGWPPAVLLRKPYPCHLDGPGPDLRAHRQRPASTYPTAPASPPPSASLPPTVPPPPPPPSPPAHPLRPSSAFRATDPYKDTPRPRPRSLRPPCGLPCASGPNGPEMRGNGREGGVSKSVVQAKPPARPRLSHASGVVPWPFPARRLRPLDGPRRPRRLRAAPSAPCHSRALPIPARRRHPAAYPATPTPSASVGMERGGGVGQSRPRLPPTSPPGPCHVMPTPRPPPSSLLQVARL